MVIESLSSPFPWLGGVLSLIPLGMTSPLPSVQRWILAMDCQPEIPENTENVCLAIC